MMLVAGLDGFEVLGVCLLVDGWVVEVAPEFLELANGDGVMM